jgi:hypothetical protein
LPKPSTIPNPIPLFRLALPVANLHLIFISIAHFNFITPFLLPSFFKLSITSPASSHPFLCRAPALSWLLVMIFLDCWSSTFLDRHHLLIVDHQIFSVAGTGGWSRKLILVKSEKRLEA